MNELRLIARSANSQIASMPTQEYMHQIDETIERIIMEACTKYALSKFPEYESTEKWAGFVNSCLIGIKLSIKEDININNL